MAVSCLLFAQSASAIPPDMSDQALNVMCQRGLAASAVEYCRAQSKLHIENPGLRARWTMRHMECQSQAALRSTAADTGGQWELVGQIESAYRRDFADDPRLPWLAWQTARAELLRSQQALALWLATPSASPQREQALQSVRKLDALLDALEKEVKERLPLAENRAGAIRQATSRELHELQMDCALLRCESYLVRAKCYPDQSPDHLAALADVDSTVNKVLQQAAPDWAARDELLVAQATAGLEVGNRRQSLASLIRTFHGQLSQPQSDTTVTAVVVSPPSELARLRAGSALVEALCAEGKAEQAAQFVQELADGFAGPEVELAALRVAIAKLKQLPPGERPAALSVIIDDTKSLGVRFGSYWRSRGEALLVSAASMDSTQSIATNISNQPNPDTRQPSTEPRKSEPGKPELSQPDTASQAMSELLTIELRQLVAGGQISAAITKLRSAVTNATSAKDFDKAMSYALEAARLMQKEKQWLEAAELLAPLAADHPDAKDAAAAHALAAWCVAQSLKDSAVQATQQRYEQLLREQLTKWPDAPETIKAEEYLAAWLTSQKRFEDLCNAWLERAALVQDLDRQRLALDRWLDTLLAHVPKAKVTSQIDQLARLIKTDRLHPCQRIAKIAVLSAAMLTSPLTLAEAEALTDCELPDHELHQAATDEVHLAALMLLDAVYRSDVTSADAASQQLELPQLTSNVNLAWCRAVALAADELPAAQVHQWSRVFEQVKFPVSGAGLATPALKMAELRLEQLRANSASASRAALTRMQELAAANAKDPNLQLSLAAAIFQATDEPAQSAAQPDRTRPDRTRPDLGHPDLGQPERFAEAIKLVKRVAIGTKKDSEAHWRARWLETRWLLGRGEQAAARQVARLALRSSSEIQPAWWQTRFEKVVGQ